MKSFWAETPSFNNVVTEPTGTPLPAYHSKRLVDWTDADYAHFYANLDTAYEPQQSKELVHNLSGRKFRW